MKRIVALTLSILMLIVYLSSCFGRTTAKEDAYIWGDRALGFPKRQHLNALLKSDKNEFDINDVTLDFYYCFYCLDEQTMEEAQILHHYETSEGYWESNFAIYLNNGDGLDFEMGDKYCIIDCENKVNAELYKYITFTEAFKTNYGYTTNDFTSVINYTHSERITIPSEYFDSSNESICIYVVQFSNYVENDMLFVESKTSIEIRYELQDNNKVVFIEN
jgi:hypothetical protein